MKSSAELNVKTRYYINEDQALEILISRGQGDEKKH